MFRVSIKNILGHKLRLLLTALAITLGVAFVAGTYILSDTVSAAFTDLFGRVDQHVDAVVRSRATFTDQQGLNGGREPVPEAILSDVRAVPGVRAAAGSVLGYAQIIGKDGKAIEPSGGAPTIGVSVSNTPELSTVNALDGRLPQSEGEVAVDVNTASAHDLHVGDQVRILFTGPPRSFRIVGTIRFGDANGLANATLAAFDVSTAQQVLNRSAQFDEIRVAADPGVSQETVRDHISQALNGRYEVLTGKDYTADTTKTINDSLSFFTTALLVFAAIALFVGAFIIFNTFSILLAQRTRELALLRALGATARQVMISVLIEAFVVALVASLLGIALGIGVAFALEKLLGAFGLVLPTAGLQFQARTVIVSLIVGIGVTLVAAIAPARRTRRVPPVAAMQLDVVAAPSAVTRRRVISGTITTAAAVAILFIGLFGSVSNSLSLVGLGALLTFVGAAILAPLVARPSARLIGWPLARLMRFPGRLGRENAMRNPLRTSRTAAALMIGIGLIGFFTIVASSFKASVTDTVDNAIGADFIISNFGSQQGFSPDVATRVAQVPEVARYGEFRFGQFKDSDGNTQFLQASTPDAFDGIFKLVMTQGRTADLGDQALFISKTIADSKGYKLGQKVSMTFARTGQRELAVSGVFDNSKNAFAGDYIINLGAYNSNYTDPRDNVVGVDLKPGVSAADGKKALNAALVDYSQVKIQDRATLKQDQEHMIDQLLGVIYVLLALAIVIALFGIVNTLALSVFERTRELGLLRAVGMTRREVRAMVRWESVIVAVIGAYLGVIIGSFFGWATVRALKDQGVTTFSYPVVTVVVFVILAAIAGIIAGIFPARRAARTDVLKAIAAT